MLDQSPGSSRLINSVNTATNLICFFRVVFSRPLTPNTKLKFVPPGLLIFACDRFGLRLLNFVLGVRGGEKTPRAKNKLSLLPG